MGRGRLKRLKFHSRLCCAALIAVLFAGYIRISGSALNALLAAAICLICCIALKGTDVWFCNAKALIRRNLLAVLLPAVTVYRTASGAESVFAALIFGITLLILWSFLAKRWIRHELTPGWTFLIYDSEENRKQANAIAECRPDLIENAGQYRCQVKHNAVSEAKTDSINLQEMDHLVRVFRIPQMVICMEHGEEVQEYCRKNGIITFIPEEAGKEGSVLYPDKIRYIMPVL